MSKSARVWGWGEKIEDVRTNCEKICSQKVDGEYERVLYWSHGAREK